MMNSLFSMFEPSNMNKMTLFMLPAMFFLFYYHNNSKSMSTIKKIMKYMKKEMKLMISNNLITLLMNSMFMTMLYMNMMSMTPYSFTLNSQISVVASFSIPMFISIITAAMIKTPMKTISHLVPSGSPMILSPFLVMIELTSMMIRPITLSVRLIANMTAGHLIIHLLSKLFFSMKLMMLFTPFLSMGLIMAEMMVAMIQSYIFCILMSIYFSE